MCRTGLKNGAVVVAVVQEERRGESYGHCGNVNGGDGSPGRVVEREREREREKIREGRGQALSNKDNEWELYG